MKTRFLRGLAVGGQTTLLVAGLLLLPPFSQLGQASQELLDMQQNHGQWATTGRDYALTRYSSLDQISTQNAKDLKVAWTFSTGVLRGHEGAPLVVGDTMYLVTPFPNIIYALDLADPNHTIKWKYRQT